MADTAGADVGTDKVAPQVVHQPTLLGGAENMKLLFDEALDNRRELLARARAWESVSLDQAQTASRRAQNAASFDKAMDTLIILSQQVGTTESQQTVSPIRTGAADTETQQPAGATYPPIRNVDQGAATATNVVQTALGAIAAQIAALQDVVSKLADALVPVIVTASGGASTPSQTTTKPAA